MDLIKKTNYAKIFVFEKNNNNKNQQQEDI